MSFESSLNVSVSGMAAQRQRVNTISENIANASTTRTPQGGPYRRRIVTLAAVSNDRTFEEELRSQQRSLDTATEVKVVGISQDNSCLLYTSPSPRDGLLSRMPSSA